MGQYHLHRLAALQLLARDQNVTGAGKTIGYEVIIYPLPKKACLMNFFHPRAVDIAGETMQRMHKSPAELDLIRMAQRLRTSADMPL